MAVFAALPVLTGAVAATSIAGMALIGSAVIGTVGAITGNKSMQKIGGILGLAGGVAALAGATGSVIGSTAAKAAGGAAASGAGSAASLAGKSAALAAPTVTGSVSGLPGASALTPGVAGSTTGVVASYGVPGVTTAATSAGGGGIIGGAIEKFKSLRSALGDEGMGALIKVGGEAVAGGFKTDPNVEQVELNRQKQDLELEEMRRKAANADNAGLINIGMHANPNADPYANYPYVTPAVAAARGV